jgi:hypothetical protein
MSIRCLIAFALFAPAIFAQSPCEGAKMYATCEMAFELPAGAHPNPYATVDLRIEFRSPRRRTYAMPAFWDGGRKLVVRFSPAESGQWDYHVTSNIAEWNDKTGSFSAAASESPGFLLTANVHHWMYTEKAATGLFQPHLWMGANEPAFATMDDAAFRAMVDARASQKFTHVRGVILADPAAYAAGAPNVDYFRRLDARVRYVTDKGMIADLVLDGGGALTKLFPTPDDRRRFVRHMVARYAPFNVTWQGVERFEEYPDGRALMKEIGGYFKELDPYKHPRTTGGRVTSSVLLDDGWMDFALESTSDRNVNAIEHMLYPVPFVNVASEQEDAAAFRRRLWNATMDGQYLGLATAPDEAKAKALTIWFDILAGTRYWELEPYFDVDGGRAVALEDTEYLVYLEKPGPLEVTVEKHGYEIFWIDPATGERTKAKKFSGEHFTIEPPNKSHDWILHVVREGRVAGMNRSYKFESRRIVMQEVEANSPKVPFTLEAPKTELSISRALPFETKITRESRATRSMLFLWMGDVAADKQGYRVIATGAKGQAKVPADIAKNFPATMHLRLYGMNANGKVYELDSALDLKQ